MTTYFIASAPIAHELIGYDIYDSYDLVSKGLTTPRLISEAEGNLTSKFLPFDINSIKRIYTATSGQTFETGNLFIKQFQKPTIVLVPTLLLKPIKFSMSSLMTKEEFFKNPIEVSLSALRKKFVIALYRDTLEETFPMLVSRIKDVISIINEQENSLVIGHTFFLKFIEIYLTDQTVFESENGIVKAFHPESKPYEFLHGFAYNPYNRTVEPI